MRAIIVSLLLVTLAPACTCGPEPTGASARTGSRASEAPRTDPGSVDIAGGLSWQAREPLVSRQPSSPMRAAEYTVDGHPDAELTVFHFGAGQGGSVDDNVGRWVGQFTQPDGRASRDVAAVERADSHGVEVTTIDVSGTYAAMSPGGAPSPPREGWRMLGAIARGPEGMVFFKLTGPSAAIDDAEDAFGDLVESIAPAR
jgi:hypothetical protein